MSLPKCSIIITAYKASAKPYLDLLIESVRNLDYPKEMLEVIVVAPGTYARDLAAVANGAYGVCSPGDSYGMPKGLNEGISWASSESEYFFVLNDDVILTRDSLKNLMQYSDPNIGLLMPIGNDQQGKYSLIAYIGGKHTTPGPYRLGEFDAKFAQHARSFYPPGLIFADVLCLYAFLMHRRVWDKVGPFDENLISGDDIDYSLRCRQAGYINAIALDALVWHAGGVTADSTFTPEKRKLGQELLNKKWGGNADKGS